MTRGWEDAYQPEYFMHLQPEGTIMVDRKSMYYFRLSGVAVELALLLSKTKSIERTAKIWSNVTSEEITVQDLINQLEMHPFTAEWKKEGILDKLVISGSTKSYLPISSTLQLTNGCNLRCSFCYASSGKPYEHELTTEQWLEVLQKLATHGVSDITLTGGEARLAKGFKRILSVAGSLFTNVHLFSNGLYWKDDEIDLVAQLGNVFVQISLDGSAVTHNILRGKQDAYQETMQNVKKLSDFGVPCLIAMTINPVNFEEVFQVVEGAVEAGARVFRAGIMLPVGRAENDYLELSEQQYKIVQHQLNQAKQKWGDRISVTDWNDEDKGGSTEFCTPGYLSWYIRADGVVTPCQVEGLELGHILHESMHTIGSPERLLKAKQNAKACKCIGKVFLPSEKDLPFVYKM